MKCKWFLAIAAAVFLSALPALGQNNEANTTPPANFKKVSTLVHLPDWLPGLGTLYVDPASLPVGPYLGYNHSGHLVNVTYMISSKDFNEQKNFDNLGAEIAHSGIKVDHTSVDYNPGHPGLQEPHYHITEWFITPAQEKEEMK
jgi:hypothetical protein